jgi:outer membrane protein
MTVSIKKLSLAVACVLSGGSAYAGGMMDALMPDHAPNLIGLAVGVVPDYLGSDDTTVGVAPMARYQFKGSNRFVALIANELDVNLVNSSSWRAGPVLNYSFGREDVDDNVVDQMTTLDGFLEYGAYVQYVAADPQNPRNRWTLGLTGLTNSEDGNEGYRVRLAGQYFHQLSQAVDLNLGAGMWYADEDWNNYYFGVNAANVGTSGLPFYNAGSDVNQYFANVSAIVYLSKNWAMAGGVRYANIAGDAGDSPLVEGVAGRGSQDQWIAGVGLTYMMW